MVAATRTEAPETPIAATRSMDVRRVAGRLALAGILLVSAALNLYRLNDEGYGNTYYAAAVRSMLDSWHNFFFVSFDPAGFVSIDKPPLGFWLQTASAKIYGFTPFSIF